ncbi:hypothetical protein SALBM311S_09903 [Streptomyces alboniger]
MAVVGESAGRDAVGDHVGRDEHAGRRRIGARRHGDTGDAVHRPRRGRRTGEGDEVGTDRANACRRSWKRSTIRARQPGPNSTSSSVHQPAGVAEPAGQPQCRVDRPELPRPGSANPTTGTGEALASRTARSRSTASACSPGPYCMPSRIVGDWDGLPARRRGRRGDDAARSRGPSGRSAPRRWAGAPRVRRAVRSPGRSGPAGALRPDQSHRGVRWGQGVESRGPRRVATTCARFRCPRACASLRWPNRAPPFRPSVRYPGKGKCAADGFPHNVRIALISTGRTLTGVPK